MRTATIIYIHFSSINYAISSDMEGEGAKKKGEKMRYYCYTYIYILYIIHGGDCGATIKDLCQF